MIYTYKTKILFTLSDAVDAPEHTVPLVIKYTVYPGCEPTREQPGEGPSVTIREAGLAGHDAPLWLYDRIEGDEALTAELLAYAAEADECARDQAADAKRDELREYRA